MVSAVSWSATACAFQLVSQVPKPPQAESPCPVAAGSPPVASLRLPRLQLGPNVVHRRSMTEEVRVGETCQLGDVLDHYRVTLVAACACPARRLAHHLFAAGPIRRIGKSDSQSPKTTEKTRTFIPGRARARGIRRTNGFSRSCGHGAESPMTPLTGGHRKCGASCERDPTAANSGGADHVLGSCVRLRRSRCSPNSASRQGGVGSVDVDQY